MRRKTAAGAVAVLLLLTALFGCGARKDTAMDLSANDIINVLGADYDTMKRSIGTNISDNDAKRAKSYRYTRSIMGADTDFSLTMDDDDKVEKIIVYTDEKGLKTWKDELGLKYGVPAADTWRDGDTKVRVSDVGDTKMIFIEKNV